MGSRLAPGSPRDRSTTQPGGSLSCSGSGATAHCPAGTTGLGAPSATMHFSSGKRTGSSSIPLSNFTLYLYVRIRAMRIHSWTVPAYHSMSLKGTSTRSPSENLGGSIFFQRWCLAAFEIFRTPAAAPNRLRREASIFCAEGEYLQMARVGVSSQSPRWPSGLKHRGVPQVRTISASVARSTRGRPLPTTPQGPQGPRASSGWEAGHAVICLPCSMAALAVCTLPHSGASNGVDACARIGASGSWMDGCRV